MDVQNIVKSQTDVALSLTKQILQANQNSNMVLSPLSIQVALCIIAAGSGGSTRDQLFHFLKTNSEDQLSYFVSEIVSPVFAANGSTPDDEPDLSFTDSVRGRAYWPPRLSYANSVWVDNSLLLKQAFKQTMKNVYNADPHQGDEVIREVNSWAEKETNGLIKQVLPRRSVDCWTRLIFANALYLKAVWVDPFSTRFTEDRDFYLTNGSTVKAPFMSSGNKQYISVFDGFKVLGLPYISGQGSSGRQRRLTMYIFLPDSTNGLQALVEKLCSEPGFLERLLPKEKVIVGDLRIPKFKISCGFKACQVVKEMGLVLPFTREADLTKIGDLPVGERLFVSDIFHKSAIAVNEQGTEAAAFVSGPLSGGGSVPEERVDFVADHPFLFMIREDVSGLVLFIGHVINPLTQA